MAGLGSVVSLVFFGGHGAERVMEENTKANKKIKLIFFEISNESYF